MFELFAFGNHVGVGAFQVGNPDLKEESNLSGEISARLPIKVTKVDRNRIAGIVRDGRAKVILETASGNITVEEPEE